MSASSTATSESDLDSRERDRDKKGKKNSVFGNLFRKKSRKPSKDGDIGREEDTVAVKGRAPNEVIIENKVNEDENSSNSRDSESSSERGTKNQTFAGRTSVSSKGAGKADGGLELSTMELVCIYSF